MSFKRQMERASQKQELEIVNLVVADLNAEIDQLKGEVRSYYRAMGAMVKASGGEIRFPKDIKEYLKGMKLESDVDDETEEFVFKLTSAATESVESA